MKENMSYKIIGEKGLYKKERKCLVAGSLKSISREKDIVGFARWKNTGEPFLVFRANNREIGDRLIFITEEILKEIIAWFKAKKKEPSELKKLIKKKKKKGVIE